MSQEIVIYKAVGGFGLSLKGQAEYLRRKGKEAYFYKQERYRHRDGEDLYVRAGMDEHPLIVDTLTRDYGPECADYEWADRFLDNDIPRDDPDLIALIREMGDEAMPKPGSLKIVEIPDGVAWKIHENDAGYEWIAEKRRTWD